MSVRLPDGVLMCWCGMLYHFPADAERCEHQPTPYVPGLYDQPNPARVAGTTPGTVYAPGRRRARQRRIIAAVLLIALTLVGLFFAASACDPGTGSPMRAPATYGHPGPNGGPQ
jgi:hypothetical protein